MDRGARKMADAGYWIWLSSVKGLSASAALKLLERYGSAEGIRKAAEEHKSEDGSSLSLLHGSLDLSEAGRISSRCAEKGVRPICFDDAEYPERLRNIYDPPLVLYVKGRLPDIESSLCIGAVGTRRAGRYGLNMAAEIGSGLALAGAVIVTGAAEGIDTAAASSALDSGGVVIAVLGTAIDVIYPAHNAGIFRRIESSGALVSEHPPGYKTVRASFARRNRIISGLSLGVAVIQAPEKSGALITAACAAEQGRDVFVVPGRADDPGFRGSNMLIRDGARLIFGAEDIIDEYRESYALNPGFDARFAARGAAFEAEKDVDKEKSLEYIDLNKAPAGNDVLENIILSSIAEGKNYADQLIDAAGGNAQEVLSKLTIMTVAGRISALPDGRYEIKIQ